MVWVRLNVCRLVYMLEKLQGYVVTSYNHCYDYVQKLLLRFGRMDKHTYSTFDTVKDSILKRLRTSFHFKVTLL